jgi:hypothetical protein
MVNEDTFSFIFIALGWDKIADCYSQARPADEKTVLAALNLLSCTLDWVITA